MPKTTLGIQIGAREALAVHLKGGWRSATVDRVIRVELPLAPGAERGAALQAAALPRADVAVSALPADAVFPRSVTLPFTDRARLEQAAPLEAEESLPLALEDVACHLQVLRRHRGESTVLLAAAPETRLELLLEPLRAAGLEPRVVDVEALALAAVAARTLPKDRTAVAVDLGASLCQAVVLGPEGPETFHAFSAPPGDPALAAEVALFVSSQGARTPPVVEAYLSGPGAGEQDLEAWTQALDVPVRLLPFPSSAVADESGGEVPWPAWAIPLGLAFREGTGARGSQINLLHGRLARERGAAPWKGLAVRGGAYALGLLALWGLSVWIESAYRDSQLQTLRGEVREVFRQALPEVTNVVSEIDQLRTAVRELESRAASLGSLVDSEVSPLRILREISSRIPPEIEVEFRDFTVEEGRVRVEGVTTSFDAIDKIKADLSSYPRFLSVTVSDAKAGVEREKVLFKLTINLNREG